MNPKRVRLEIRDCLIALLQSLVNTTTPWGDWQVSVAYPAQDTDDHRQQPLLYVDAPELAAGEPYLGGIPVQHYKLTLGVCNGPASGGIDEHIVMVDELIALFTDPAVYKQAFDVEIGGTLIPGHTLMAQGIRITGLDGPHRLHASGSAAIHSQLVLNISL